MVPEVGSGPVSTSPRVADDEVGTIAAPPHVTVSRPLWLAFLMTKTQPPVPVSTEIVLPSVAMLVEPVDVEPDNASPFTVVMAAESGRGTPMTNGSLVRAALVAPLYSAS